MGTAVNPACTIQWIFFITPDWMVICNFFCYTVYLFVCLLSTLSHKWDFMFCMYTLPITLQFYQGKWMCGLVRNRQVQLWIILDRLLKKKKSHTSSWIASYTDLQHAWLSFMCTVGTIEIFLSKPLIRLTRIKIIPKHQMSSTNQNRFCYQDFPSKETHNNCNIKHDWIIKIVYILFRLYTQLWWKCKGTH